MLLYQLVSIINIWVAAVPDGGLSTVTTTNCFGSKNKKLERFLSKSPAFHETKKGAALLHFPAPCCQSNEVVL